MITLHSACGCHCHFDARLSIFLKASLAWLLVKFVRSRLRLGFDSDFWLPHNSFLSLTDVFLRRDFVLKIDGRGRRHSMYIALTYALA